MTPNGERMAFETFDPTAGTTRIRVVDLTTGVITGIPLAPTSSGQFAANWNVTSLASFPGGPFTNSRRAGNHSFAATGATSEPDVRSDGVLASEVTGGLVVSFSNGLSTFSDVGSHPTLSDPTNNVVVFQLTNPATVNGEPQYTDLAFKPITGFGTTPATFLPPIISGNGTDELQPDFTPDGRYRRLRPGTYQVTPRLLTRGGIVHELGKPHMIRIR